MTATTEQHLETPMHDATAGRLPVAICGGGISGLALAAFLTQLGVPCKVFEKSAQVGGVMRSIRDGEYLYEGGPNTLLNKYASIDGLIDWAGLKDEAIRVSLRTQSRHVYVNGQLHEAPTSPKAAMRSKLLRWGSKMAILKEPFVKGLAEKEESVATFVRRRLGEEWLQNLITPMVSGLWGGDPEKLSVNHAFPVMKKMEGMGGSLIRGAIKQKKAAKTDQRRGDRAMISFPDGLGRLPQALVGKLGDVVEPNREVVGLHPVAGGGWNIRVADSSQPEAASMDYLCDHVVLCTEAGPTAHLLETLAPDVAATLAATPYNRLTVASLAIEKNCAKIPHGFGFLVARNQGIGILGAIVNSNFLPGRALEGEAMLSVFCGGELEPEVANMDESGLMTLLREDLGKVIDWDGTLQGAHFEHWPRAIPQYDMQQGDREAACEQVEQQYEGMHLAGNWRGGVSIGERIENMSLLADRLCKKIDLTAAASSGNDHSPERSSHGA